MILTTVPVSTRRPGVYSEFEFVADAQGLIALPNRVVIVAESKGGSAAVETPIQIFSEADADAKLGVGTRAALGCRMVFQVGKLRGGAMPQVWACPIAEPGGGTAAAETITVTGAPTAAGTIVLRIAGRVINAGVSVGDSVTTMALSIKAAMDALKTTLPVTGSPALGVVTATDVTKGVNGNDVMYEVIAVPAGVTVVCAQSVAGAGAASITNAIANLYDQRYHGVAISNHTTTDITAMLLQRALDWGYTQQNYRFYFVGSRDSLGTATPLASASNDFGINVTVCEQMPRMPIEIAAAVAADWLSYDAPNVNTDSDVLPLEPPSGAYAFTNAEIETALAAGMTPLSPSGSFVKIERLVSTETTVASAPFEPTRDMAYARTSAYVAEQIAIKMAQGLSKAVMSNDILDDARDIVIEVDRAAERAGYLKDVDTFLPQIRTEFASAPAGRLNAVNPHRVAGPLHQAVVHNTMYQ